MQGILFFQGGVSRVEADEILEQDREMRVQIVHGRFLPIAASGGWYLKDSASMPGPIPLVVLTWCKHSEGQSACHHTEGVPPKGHGEEVIRISDEEIKTEGGDPRTC